MKKALKIVLLGAVAVATYVVTVQVSALLEREKETREEERLQKEMDQSMRMAMSVTNQTETSARALANGDQDRHPTLQSLVEEAHTVLVCEHRVRWGSIRCQVTQIPRLGPHAASVVGVGDPILNHERKVRTNHAHGEGMVTFLCSPPLSMSHGFAIHDGRIRDFDFGSFPGEPSLRGEWTLTEVVGMIMTANQAGGR